MLTVGSLFSGIGGFDLGFERAGMRVVWHCERDEFCQRVLRKHWPHVPCFPDITELRHPPAVDVLCGGFPCQDLSYAGPGEGIGGARSGLWSEYARLVGELRPRYVVVENVAALLARGLGVVVGDLAALGYDAEWDCLPASAFGAPHQRDRIWLVAYPHGSGRGARVADLHARQSHAEGRSHDMAHAAGGGRSGRQDRPASIRPPAERGEEVDHAGHGGSALADADEGGRARRSGEQRPRRRDESADRGGGELQDADERALQPWRVGGRAAQAGGPGWWAVEPPVGRVAHGVPDRLDQLAALGNALVPQIAEWIGRRIIEWEGQHMTCTCDAGPPDSFGNRDKIENPDCPVCS